MLAKASISAGKKEDIKSYREAFPELKFAEDEEQKEVKESDEYILYVWDCNKPLFDIYDILRSYPLNEFYSIDSAILLALVKDHKLPITESLKLIPYAHSGYVDVIIENRDKDGK